MGALPIDKPLAPDVAASAKAAAERLRWDPADADALFVLAASRAAGGRYSEALVLVERLLKVSNDYPGVWLLKRKVHESLGDPVGAASCMRTAALRCACEDT